MGFAERLTNSQSGSVLMPSLSVRYSLNSDFHAGSLSAGRKLSAGQKKKVLIAGNLATPANLYIWDEPLNFVDIISRIQLERLLGANTPTMLLAEHDRYFCENTGTKRLYITKG